VLNGTLELTGDSMNTDSRHPKLANPQRDPLHSINLPNVDKLAGRVFSGLIVLIVVGALGGVAMMAYRYFANP